MKVTIKLFAHFKEGRFETEEWDLAEGTQIAQVLDRLQIESKSAMAIINGNLSLINYVLSDHDILSIVPALEGG